MRKSQLIRLGGIALCAAILAPVAAEAADYQITASGPLTSSFSDSSTFDGTTHGTLPPMLDIARLTGGSFTATFRFTAPAPGAGTGAVYDLSPTSGITYDLLDSTGLVVHHGSNPFDTQAFLLNNSGTSPFIADQVFLSSNVGTVTGAAIPTAIYSPPGEFISAGSFDFNGTVSPGFNYINDLNIPIDAGTYLGFPTRRFNVVLELADGDFIQRVNPYQIVDTGAEYQINALTVTLVPEPTSLALLAVGGLTLLTRTRRET